MDKPERIRIAVVGARRGAGIVNQMRDVEALELTALCDIRPEVIDGLKERHPEVPCYLDYDEMLAADICDAVAVVTPPTLHAEHAVKALNAGKHVFCEVIAGVTVEELWSVVEAVERTGLAYMMAEQVNFRRYILMILNMIQQGVFGELTYAHCGYVHELKKLSAEIDGPGKWRYEWNFNRVGNYYPTHPIGPVAWWLDLGGTDRMVSLVSMDSKPASFAEYLRSGELPEDHPARSETRPPTLGDVNKTLIRTEKGRLIDLWFDVNSNRPVPSTVHFELQGTQAAYDYDFARHQRIYIKGKTNGWQDFWEHAAEYEHPIWRDQLLDLTKRGKPATGHYMLQEFAKAIRNGTRTPIDVYDAADWSAIIPLSQESVRNGSQPVRFPDFRKGNE